MCISLSVWSVLIDRKRPGPWFISFLLQVSAYSETTCHKVSFSSSPLFWYVVLVKDPAFPWYTRKQSLSNCLKSPSSFSYFSKTVFLFLEKVYKYLFHFFIWGSHNTWISLTSPSSLNEPILYYGNLKR